MRRRYSNILIIRSRKWVRRRKESRNCIYFGWPNWFPTSFQLGWKKSSAGGNFTSVRRLEIIEVDAGRLFRERFTMGGRHADRRGGPYSSYHNNLLIIIHHSFLGVRPVISFPWKHFGEILTHLSFARSLMITADHHYTSPERKDDHNFTQRTVVAITFRSIISQIPNATGTRRTIPQMWENESANTTS